MLLQTIPVVGLDQGQQVWRHGQHWGHCGYRWCVDLFLGVHLLTQELLRFRVYLFRTVMGTLLPIQYDISKYWSYPLFQCSYGNTASYNVRINLYKHFCANHIRAETSLWPNTRLSGFPLWNFDASFLL